MTIRELLRDQVGRIVPVDEREASSTELTLHRLTWPGSLFDERENDHHLTASAFVVSSRGVILHRHRLLGIWVQPGGHVDAGETPAEAAARETLEETGLVVELFEPVEVFHVDVHPGPRGHTHYDLRYVAIAEPLDPTPSEGESPDVFWFDFDAAARRCEPADRAALEKLARSAAVLGVRDS